MEFSIPGAPRRHVHIWHLDAIFIDVYNIRKNAVKMVYKCKCGKWLHEYEDLDSGDTFRRDTGE